MTNTPEQGDALVNAPWNERSADHRVVRCRLTTGSGPGFTEEMAHLLRTRLRLALWILLGGFAFHFFKHLLPLWPEFDHRPLWLLFTGIEITVMVVTLVILGSRHLLSLQSLRFLELITFGMIAALFAWLQVDTYHDGALLRAIVPGHEDIVFRLAGMSAGLRWFLLIVLYGTFIPNTARRCAIVVSSLAVLPVVLNVIGNRVDPLAGSHTLSVLPEMSILMGTAVVIAVFGSHKLRELYQKAHEAQRVGQYRLKEVIGFGGMGTVYLGEHLLLRRPCAIKLIRPDQAGDPRTLQRFEREVQAAASLTHWNTIEIFDYGHTEDGAFYYVMEYLPGMNLQDMVERYGPLPPARAVHLLRQVCQGLREAHQIGLVHRDIKPSNIIACERGKVYDVAKLVDFGLVKAFGIAGASVQLTREGVFTGSPAFMSPEQAQGHSELDARSDIYNVGAVGHFLMTGQLLFERPSILQMLHAHAFEPFVPGREFQTTVPADLQCVLLRCLEKDPERRYPDTASLEKALAACEEVGAWTAEQAEQWWQRREDASLPDALETSQRAQLTIAR